MNITKLRCGGDGTAPRRLFFFRILSIGALGILLTLGIYQCSFFNDRRNIQDYYYPLEQLKEGQVYCYDMTVNGQSVSDYWYYTVLERDSGVFLSGTNYDRFFHINQMVTEKITSGGSVAKRYTVFELDSLSGKAISSPVRLTAPDLFPFSVKDSSGVFLFSMEYHPVSAPLTKLYLIRNRRYTGDGPDFVLNGQKYPTIRMSIREAIGNEQEGASEIEGRGEELYARGKGLVYFEKRYGKNGEVVRQYRLKEIISMSEFEQRAGSVLNDGH